MNAGRCALLAAGLLAACAKPAPPGPPGIDPQGKVIRIGVLNDESGPVASIGRPFAIGKRILARQVNAGGSGLLPEGWTVQLVERDHGYDAQRAVKFYDEIRGQVLFIGHSFGTPNTLPLRPLLERDHLVAFPASLSSRMAEFERAGRGHPTQSLLNRKESKCATLNHRLRRNIFGKMGAVFSAAVIWRGMIR